MYGLINIGLTKDSHIWKFIYIVCIYIERESFSFFVNTCWYCTNADDEFLRGGSPEGVHVFGEGQKRNEPF